MLIWKFGEDWLKNKKVTGKKTNWGWKTPPPSAYRVNSFQSNFTGKQNKWYFKYTLSTKPVDHENKLHVLLLKLKCVSGDLSM